MNNVDETEVVSLYIPSLHETFVIISTPLVTRMELYSVNTSPYASPSSIKEVQCPVSIRILQRSRRRELQLAEIYHPFLISLRVLRESQKLSLNPSRFISYFFQLWYSILGSIQYLFLMKIEGIYYQSCKRPEDQEQGDVCR